MFSPNPMFQQKKIIFYVVKRSGKSWFSHFRHLCIHPFQKIFLKNPLSLVTFKKSCPNSLYPILILHNQSHVTKERTGNSLSIAMKKGQKHAYIILEWSLTFFSKDTFAYVLHDCKSEWTHFWPTFHELYCCNLRPIYL